MPEIFGLKFFNKNIQNIYSGSAVLDFPLYSDYTISFNDKIQVLLTGSINNSYALRVNLSGTVLIPNIGEVSLLNLTIEEANKKSKQLINESFVD